MLGKRGVYEKSSEGSNFTGEFTAFPFLKKFLIKNHFISFDLFFNI